MIRPTLIDLNPIKLKCCPFMISLDKCTGSCNVLPPKIYIPKETKDINIKTFNMITNKTEAKTMTNIFHVIANANLIVQLAIQIKNGITKLVNVTVKVVVHAKMIVDGILAHVFVRIACI